MTDQPARGMTMASRGQAAHKPDPKPAPHLSMTERIRVAEFEAAPEPEELVVERVAGALRAFMPATVSSNLRRELSREAAHAAIAAMGDNR